MESEHLGVYYWSSIYPTLYVLHTTKIFTKAAKKSEKMFHWLKIFTAGLVYTIKMYSNMKYNEQIFATV